MWAGTQERWERGVGGRIDEEHDSPENGHRERDGEDDHNDHDDGEAQEAPENDVHNSVTWITIWIYLKHIGTDAIMHRNNWTS